MRKSLIALLLILLLLPCTAFSGETIHPFAYGHGGNTGIVFGAWCDGQWISAVNTQPHLNEGDRYRVYDVEGFYQNATAGIAQCYRLFIAENMISFDDGDAPEIDWKQVCKGYTGFVYFSLTPAFPNESDWIAVSCPWNPMPRPVSSSSTETTNYIEITQFILESKGLHNPDVHLLQVLHVDLDGDGAEETLVSAFHTKTGNLGIGANAADYSVIYMLAHGDAIENLTILAESFFTGDRMKTFPTLIEVLGVLDLNGDSVMEVVLKLQASEAFPVRVLEFNGSELETVYKYSYDAYTY